MKTALLIHGYNGIPKIFTYFKAELTKLGYKVIMPNLPTQQEISFDNWESELGRLQLPSEISLLVAHSVGNEFMVRYCAKHGLKSELYIGLAGFAESFTHDGRDDLNEVIAKMQCNAEEITKFRGLTAERYAIYSNDDHVVPYSILQDFPLKISARALMIPGIGHMGKKSGLEKLPEAIKIIKTASPNDMKTDFMIAGRTRNIPNILKVCEAMRVIGKTYYCFAENEQSHKKAGFDLHDHPDRLADDYEQRDLNSDSIRTIFDDDLDGLKTAENFLLVLPAGTSSHIEAGIAYGLGKSCYAIGSYEKTDSLYLIFDKIFANLDEMKEYFKDKN